MFAAIPEVRTLERDLKKAGVAFVDELGRRVDIHAHRHTYGTLVVLSGARPGEAQQLMRHADPRLTMGVYSHVGLLPTANALARVQLPAAVDADRVASKRAAALIDLLGLGGYATTPIADLSTGTRRIVELACILAMDPAVILLDEPSAGVAQSETEALGPLLQRVKATTGSAMLIIEHDMVLLSSVCDELVAMELGHVICKGPPDSVLADPRVIESYLGTNEAAIRRTGRAATSPSVNGDSLTVATP